MHLQAPLHFTWPSHWTAMLGKQGSVCHLPRPSFLEKHKNSFQCSHEQTSGCLTDWVQIPAWQPPGCAALGKWIKILTVISFPHLSNGQQQDIHKSVNIMLIYSTSRSPISGLPWWLGSKESACKQVTIETWIWSLGQEEPPEEEVVAHSSILAWKIPWTEELRGLWSMGLQSWTLLRWLNTHLHSSRIHTRNLPGTQEPPKYRGMKTTQT